MIHSTVGHIVPVRSCFVHRPGTHVPLDLLQSLASQYSEGHTRSSDLVVICHYYQDRSSVIEAARSKIMQMEPSVDGEHGHNQLWAVTMTLMDGYGLSRSDAAILLKEYNSRPDCDPETDKALEHKLDDAQKRNRTPVVGPALIAY